MVNENFQCRVCGNSTKIFKLLYNVPKQVSILTTEPYKYSGQEIALYKCDNCNHYQIKYDNSIDYYDDYIMLPHAESIYSFRERQIKALYELNNNAKSFIEIGCGDGSFLKHASKFYDRVVGNEPSQIYNKLTVEKGFECIPLYITSNFQVTETFDSFCAKQVFEHLPNPKDTLLKIFEMINEEGVGFIEIPNGAKTLYDSRYFDIFTDHVNYFTPTSLSKLAEEAGFVVVRIEETFGGDYLECYVKKPKMQKSLESRKLSDVEYLKNIIKDYGRVGAFGAGAKGFVLMTSLSEVKPFDFIFDDDPNKTGRFLPNSTAAVTIPNIEDINNLDLIIIFSASYQDEVLAKLRNKYNYEGDVIGLQYGITFL